jgi:uncharacterized protein YdaU (DUF1376 family)
MNYYKRHIGDYAAKAGHLSPLEHGVYTLLIDAYYNREEAPTKAEAIRWARARSADELAAVEAVLAEFFVEADGRFVQNRIEEELFAFRAKQEVNRQLGARGGKANAERNAKRIATETLSEQEAKQVPRREANDKPSHKPLATSHEEANTPVVPKGDSAAVVVDAYHSALPKCQGAHVMNDKRKKRIGAAVRLAKQVCASQGWEYGDGTSFWSAYFAECATDPWMRGEVPNPKNAAWRQNLDVLLAEDRFAGIMDKAIASMRGGQ